MKKLTLVALGMGLLVTGICSARPLNFNDVYNVNNGQYLAGRVVSGDISLSRLSPTQFAIVESGSLEGGIVPIVVGQDSAHNCLIQIQDKDFNYPTLISQDCIGDVKVVDFSGSYSNTNITMGNG